MFFTKKPVKLAKNTKLHYIGEVLAGSRKPPVTKDKDDKRKGKKICQPCPVGGRTIEHNAPVTANERRKWIEIDEGTVSLRHDRFGINYWRQVHPGHQHETDSLHDVANEHAQRGQQPRAPEHHEQLRN